MTNTTQTNKQQQHNYKNIIYKQIKT